MNNTLDELIKKITELNTVGSLCFSDYKDLISLARQLQVERSN